MTYKKYIDLGFERFDLDDKVEHDKTGYGGFTLTKHISHNVMICAYYGELGNPKMYIKKAGSETYHIINITPEMVIDLLDKKENS